MDGSLPQVQSKRSSETYRNFANGFIYSAAGAVTAMRLGNGKWENTVFNSRMQPTQIGLGNGVNSQNLLKLDYEYGATASVNNGNVTKQTNTLPGVANPFVQTYSYDELNRLTNAEEIKNSVQQWEQTFTYDRFGNRNYDQANTTTLVKNCGSSPNFEVCSADVPIVNPSVNTANNKLTGTTYDAAGNVIEDAEGREFTYDAENKQVEVENGSSQLIGQYYFDGDGKRVKKVVPNGETTIFVYDASGRLIGEYSTEVQPAQDAKTQYLTADHLGTPRISTNGVGAVVSRSDYMPYGEEITTGRSSGQGYVVDDVRQGFTGYESDDETGLEYAEARMYANRLGRFTGADPLLSSGRAEVPQTWYRYGYALNSPILFKDPSGEDIIILIWATEDGKIGHAGIAVSNYKTVKQVVDGKVTETKVADGTYTYRDLWPGGAGAGKDNYDKDIPAAYGKEFAASLNQLLNTDITGSEGYAPDGAIRLKTDYDTDNSVHIGLDQLQKDKPNYNGITMNCTDFVEKGVELATGKDIRADEVVFSNLQSTGSLTQDRLIGGRQVPVYSTTPNQLFKAARGLDNATVVKDPGGKVDNPFTRSVVTGRIKRAIKP